MLCINSTHKELSLVENLFKALKYVTLFKLHSNCESGLEFVSFPVSLLFFLNFFFISPKPGLKVYLPNILSIVHE